MKLAIVTSLSALLLSACANPINVKTASIYANDCRQLQAQNEWGKARKACGRAATNGKLGNMPDQSMAVLWYEYGRTSGAICEYADAQKALDEALRLDQAARGPVYMSLLELARLSAAQGKYTEAAGYYERFFSAVPMDEAERGDPIGLAEVIEEQAEAYRQIGNAEAAKAKADRAKALRAANPGKTSNTDHTPYGKFCDQKS